VTASVGVALTRCVDGEVIESALWQLIDRADAAMYAAKAQGRDRVAAAAPMPRPRAVRSVEGHGLPGPRTSDVA
jgi:predicted signal transduction protein with EAL and GGDEF domain